MLETTSAECAAIKIILDIPSVKSAVTVLKIPSAECAETQIDLEIASAEYAVTHMLQSPSTKNAITQIVLETPSAESLKLKTCRKLHLLKPFNNILTKNLIPTKCSKCRRIFPFVNISQ